MLLFSNLDSLFISVLVYIIKDTNIIKHGRNNHCPATRNPKDPNPQNICKKSIGILNTILFIVFLIIMCVDSLSEIQMVQKKDKGTN